MKLAFFRRKQSKEELDRQIAEEFEAAMAKAQPPSDAERTWHTAESGPTWASTPAVEHPAEDTQLSQPDGPWFSEAPIEEDEPIGSEPASTEPASAGTDGQVAEPVADEPVADDPVGDERVADEPVGAGSEAKPAPAARRTRQTPRATSTSTRRAPSRRTAPKTAHAGARRSPSATRSTKTGTTAGRPLTSRASRA
jgi:hypothetical protein